MRRSWALKAIWLSLVCLAAGTSRGIVTEDIPRSESDPVGYAPYSGFDWSFVYRVSGSSGVAVDPYWVLTAKHVSSGNITVGSTVYTALETVTHSTADLRLIRYDKAFPGHYPIYTGEFPGIPAPANQRLTGLMVGYGRTGDVLSSTTYNWHGSTTAGTKRWGDSRIDALGSQSGIGDYFIQYFDTGATAYAGGGADKDSGGGVFVQSNGTWYLAGTMVSVTGPDGAYTGTIAVRLPSYETWILSAVPEPATGMIYLAGAAALFAVRRMRRRNFRPM